MTMNMNENEDVNVDEVVANRKSDDISSRGFVDVSDKFLGRIWDYAYADRTPADFEDTTRKFDEIADLLDGFVVVSELEMEQLTDELERLSDE